MFQDEFAGDGVDLYDDVIAAPAGGNGGVSSGNTGDGGGDTTSPNEETNGNAPYHQLGNNIQPNQIGRRHQLYVGNLTWVYICIHTCAMRLLLLFRNILSLLHLILHLLL